MKKEMKLPKFIAIVGVNGEKVAFVPYRFYGSDQTLNMDLYYWWAPMAFNNLVIMERAYGGRRKKRDFSFHESVELIGFYRKALSSKVFGDTDLSDSKKPFTFQIAGIIADTIEDALKTYKPIIHGDEGEGDTLLGEIVGNYTVTVDPAKNLIRVSP